MDRSATGAPRTMPATCLRPGRLLRETPCSTKAATSSRSGDEGASTLAANGHKLLRLDSSSK
eukprot:518711-Pyramimonas_sp.AAC.1